MTERRIRTHAVLIAGLLLCSACYGSAQYFGQNTVRYDRFDFQILQTEHFDIYFYEEEREAVQQAARMAERWYARLSRLLNHEIEERQPIIYYASHPHFQQTKTIGRAPGEGTGGVTEAFKRRVVLPFAGPLKETDHVLGHELAHAFQFDMTGSGGTLTQSNFPRALLLPLWFIEGMAEYLSVGANDPHTSMWIRDAAVNDRLPTMAQLRSPRYFPYRFGQAFWAYVAGRFGDEVIGRILNAAARTGSAEAAIQSVLRIPVDSLNAEWREAIHQTFDGIREVTKDPSDFGHAVLVRDNSGVLNSAPALSPDGSEIVFISERDRTSIDLFLADANTGELKRKLIEMATDEHLAGMQFINSAGAWDPSSRRFVLAGVVRSDPVLRIIDVDNGETLREEIFEEIGEIFNPTFSPDGRAVAFSANVGGFSDLFVFDLETDSLRRLTSDPYADLQPAWSPDGHRIAFSTDRFSTNLSILDFGHYGLALMDPVTGSIEPVAGFPGAKNVNPQWSPDGKSLYFLSDRRGITNVYRLDVSSERLFQVTNLYSGVTGITALSPALSAAANADKIAFSVYENGSYGIYTVESREVLVGLGTE